MSVPVVFACVLAVFGVAALSGWRGWSAGVGLAALSAGLIAFFAMPPIYSILVIRPLDLITLAGYLLTSLFVAALAGRAARRSVEDPETEPAGYPAYRRSPVGPISDSTPPVTIIDLPEGGRVPTLSHPDPAIADLLSSVLEIALDRAETVHRVLFYSGLQPGLKRFWITVQHQPDPDQPTSRTIGLRDEACHTINKPHWPMDSRVTWFDNGVEHIYQVSLKV